jgi:hypothetical protein
MSSNLSASSRNSSYRPCNASRCVRSCSLAARAAAGEFRSQTLTHVR